MLRPAEGAAGSPPPFDSWPYSASYMPAGVAIDVARGAPLAGPELFYLGFQTGRARRGQEPTAHGLPLGSLSGVSVWRPAGGGAEAAMALEAAGLVAFHDADEYLLELRFGAGSRGRGDLRPDLPLALRW